MVKLLQPQPGESVQDPAAVTGGFLIAADRYMKDHSDELFELPEHLQIFQRSRAFHGVELVPDTQRLALMNLVLHDIDADLLLGDTLSTLGERIAKADIILTNPPFPTKSGGGAPTRSDFTSMKPRRARCSQVWTRPSRVGSTWGFRIGPRAQRPRRGAAGHQTKKPTSKGGLVR